MVFKLAENNESDEIPDEIKKSHELGIHEKNEPLEIPNNKDSSVTKIEIEEDEISIEKLQELLAEEKQKVATLDEKFKHTLADFKNLERKTQSDIENGVNDKIDKFMIDFLQIYDDFIRAKNVFVENKINTGGLDSILKNMDSFLSRYNVQPIDSLGEIFDPNFHEAISVMEDSSLDEDTITKEMRKGYISHNRVIRPALVEISKNKNLNKKSE